MVSNPKISMTPAQIGMQLHARKTQGETLTAEEATQLENWYALQDAEENRWLSVDTTPTNTSQIQPQTNSVLNHLTDTTQRIQTVAAENEALRREIIALKQKLATVKPARADPPTSQLCL